MTLLVVMPTYNERPNIEKITDAILAHPFTRLLVVDDASPDGTGQIADELASRYPGRLEVMHRNGPRGLGLAYVDGLRHALTQNVDAVGQMDADFSHDPKYIPDLVAKLDQSDLVIGSRYLRGVSVVNWPLHRLFLSAFANRYIRAVTGIRASDCTGAFRVWRREALAKMPLEHARANGYAFLTEMLYEATQRGLRIGEAPIVFVERAEGYSKVSGRVLAESLLTPWRLLFRGGRAKRPPSS
jgi:dolichol-phosphate mannosyltransferase